MKALHQSGYRPEIDGLRAVAVIPVILFHAGAPGFSGGYIGVDIFFVISGFLITSILLREISQGTFSIVDFYDRRARRILPALLFIMMVCLPFAWLWMLPEQMRDFSQSIVAVLLFASNVLFFLEVDYFAQNAEEKPLLHTWSLAVEEQFYIFFPLLLLLLWRLGPRTVLGSLIGLSLASLVLSEIGARSWPSANFFLIPSRVWELGLGSICAYWMMHRPPQSNAYFAGGGLTLIIFSVFYFDAATPFPSIWALIPTGGVALIILFADTNTAAGRLLSSRGFVGIGLISYSAYLWHQPLFAFARIRAVDHLPLWVFLVLSIVALVLAWLTWRFVEQPFRQRGSSFFGNKRVLGSAVVVAAGLSVFGVLGHFTGGYQTRLPDSVHHVLAVKDTQTPFVSCLFGGVVKGTSSDDTCSLGEDSTDTLEFMLIGDSFAAAIAPALDAAAKDAGQRGGTYLVSSCPALQSLGGGWAPSVQNCTQLQSEMVQKAQELGVSHVILASAWHALDPQSRCQLSNINCATGTDATFQVIAQSFAQTVAAFRDAEIDVTIIGAPPKSDVSVPDAVAKQLWHNPESQPRLELSIMDAYGPTLNALLVEQSEDINFVMLKDHFCDESICSLVTNGIPLYRDEGHITTETAESLAYLFVSQFHKVAAE